MDDPLAAALAELEAVSPTATWDDVEHRLLAPGTDADPTSHGHPRPRSRRWMLVAAAVALVLTGAAAWWGTVDDGTDLDVTDTAAPPRSAFEGWPRGWSTLDVGPVPAMGIADLAWTGKVVVVAGGSSAYDGTLQPRAFAFDPSTRTWTELPAPPFAPSRLIAADGALVAVGSALNGGVDPPTVWATLRLADDAWQSHGTVPEAPALAGYGVASSIGERGTLVWTGERVIDAGHGAVLDPATGTATLLPMPEDPVAYAHLRASTPVWNGRQVVLVGWSDQPGLAWDATGSAWSEFPAPLASAESRGVALTDGAPAVVDGDGRIVIVGGRAPDVETGWSARGSAAAYDATTDRWQPLPDPPAPATTNCPYRLVATAGHAIVVPCDSTYRTGDLLELADDGWRSIGRPEFDVPCCGGWMLGIDDALVFWSTSTDTFNDPAAPFVEAAVWRPS